METEHPFAGFLANVHEMKTMSVNVMPKKTNQWAKPNLE
jgi:hypothetical protein